jgi:hypothetical protein
VVVMQGSGCRLLYALCASRGPHAHAWLLACPSQATIYGCEQGLCQPGQEVVVVHGCVDADADG